MTEKEKLLETLSAFACFCDEHNLKWFAAYGTVIGAVRHHGFIPWDDDIDVHMFCKDYDRMLELRNNVPSGYRIEDIGDYGYTAKFVKFMDNNSSIWEFKQIPYMLGAYVDVFPLDDCPDNTSTILEVKKDFDVYYENYFDSLSKWSYTDILSLLLYAHPRQAFHAAKAKMFKVKKRELYYEKMMDSYKRLTSFEGQNKCISTGSFMNNNSFIMKKKWFAETVDMPFENMSIKLPAGYDDYLKHLYGDYMQLPPEEERKSHHGRYFVDFDKGLTIEQAKEIINCRK